MSDLIPEEGIFPDLESIIAKIPSESDNMKLYISAKVNFIEEEIEFSENKLDELENIFRKILAKIGVLLRLDEHVFDDWIETQISQIMYNNPYSAYTIAAMTVSDPETRYQMLECNEGQTLYDMLLEQLDVIEI